MRHTDTERIVWMEQCLRSVENSLNACGGKRVIITWVDYEATTTHHTQGSSLRNAVDNAMDDDYYGRIDSNN